MNLEAQIKKICESVSAGSFLLGFSGGADSTALAEALYNVGFHFKAVHFNHHLRETADRDEEFCRQFCKGRDIPFECINLNIDQKNSIEAQSRELRQKHWQSYDCPFVLLGHHNDDVLENFLLRSMRGSSSSGLSGLRTKIKINGVTYLRPFLGLPKNSLIQYLEENNISWIEDETNSENLYSRNIIRNEVLPALKRTADIKGLTRTVNNVEADALFIERCASQWLNTNALNAENFLNADDALKPRIIRQFISKILNRDFIAGHAAIERLTGELKRNHRETAEVPLGDGVWLMLAPNGDIYLTPEDFNFKWNWKEESILELPDNSILKIAENSESGEKFKLDQMPDILKVRNWHPGDRMIPFSKKTPKKVKDLFIDSKIAPEKRLQLPIILANDTIIWIPEVRRAEFARCSADDNWVSISYERI